MMAWRKPEITGFINHLSLRKTFMVVLLLVFGDLRQFAKASNFWSLTNQLPVEERPYTIPEDAGAGSSFTGPKFRSEVNKLLYPRLREMQRYCDGQCFYAPGDCKNEEYKCEMAASVALHDTDADGVLYCDIFGVDNLKESFCSRSEAQKEYRARTGKEDRFYTITLHRVFGRPDKVILAGPDNVPIQSCQHEWDENTGRRCRQTEFVAISFVDSSRSFPDKEDPEDLWYVCIAEEKSQSRVTMWYRVSTDPTLAQERITDTKPHRGSGMGVVFSKLFYDEDKISMGCQFVIQESNMTLANVTDPPKNAAFFGDLFPDYSKQIKVKLAYGYVHRNKTNDQVIEPFYHGVGPYKVFADGDLKPTNVILFNSLKIALKDHYTGSEESVSMDRENQQKIKKVLARCDNPSDFPDWYIACYPPNLQQNCVHTGRCPVMIIIEVPRTDKSFDSFHAHIYSYLPDDRSVRKTSIRPIGYAAVGFSFDNRMDRDLVISCHADGMNHISINVSLNFGHSNIFPGQVSYEHLISNRRTYGSAESNQILCSWEMKSSFVVNMFAYEPDYRQVILPGESEKLVFDLRNEEVFILTAAGNRNYPNGTIVYHDFRQTIQERFSKELFFKKAKATRTSQSNNYAMTIIFLCWFFFNF